jgi:hypothetical protein
VRSGIVVDAAEGLVDVSGQRVGGGDLLVSGLDLDGAVAAGGADEFPDGPGAPVLDPAADGQGGELVALAIVDRPACRSCLDMRNDFRSRIAGGRRPITPVGIYQWLSYVLITAGWILATTIIAGLTRALYRN